MSNTIFPLFRPIKDLYNEITGNQIYKDLTEFKAGYGSHNAWHTKFLRSEREQYNQQYLSLEKRFQEDPEILDLAKDNILRLTVFAGLERVIAIRQSLSILKHRFFLSQTTGGNLTEVLSQGLRQGYFRGAALNAFGFLGVHFNTLLWARGADFKTQLIASSAFEALFHPVDTVKTILYADTTGEYKGAMDVLGRIVSQQDFTQLYRGLVFRLIYNSAFLLHLRNLYEDNNWQYVTTPLWIASYGFLSVKTRLQISGTALTYQNAIDLAQKGAEKGMFRGIIPFVALNYFFTYQLFGYYSQQAQDNAVESIREKLQNNFSSPIADNHWSA